MRANALFNRDGSGDVVEEVIINTANVTMVLPPRLEQGKFIVEVYFNAAQKGVLVLVEETEKEIRSLFDHIAGRISAHEII